MNLIVCFLVLTASTIALGVATPGTGAPTLTETITAIGGGADCLNVQEVFMTWGWFGKVTVAVLGGLAALRPLSQALLAASTLLGPQAKVAANVLYAAGQVAGRFCIAKPAFAENFQSPAKVAAAAAPASDAGAGKPKDVGGMSDAGPT